MLCYQCHVPYIDFHFITFQSFGLTNLTFVSLFHAFYVIQETKVYCVNKCFKCMSHVSDAANSLTSLNVLHYTI